MVFNEGSTQTERRPRVRARWAALTAGVLAAVATLAFSSFLRSSATHQSNVATASSPLPAATLVTVQLTAFPAEARLWLDERELASNPATVEVKLTDPHFVRADAPGFIGVERELGRETSLVLKLEKVPAPRPAPPSAERPRSPVNAARRATIAHPAASATRCDPPFYFDARGVKKYRPDCL